MKKNSLFKGKIKSISREELRKIAGGTGNDCPSFSYEFIVSDNNAQLCAFRGPNGRICIGIIMNGKCFTL